MEGLQRREEFRQSWLGSEDEEEGEIKTEEEREEGMTQKRQTEDKKKKR